MAGNVSEWVMDVYRPVIEQTTTADHKVLEVMYTKHKKETRMDLLLKKIV